MPHSETLPQEQKQAMRRIRLMWSLEELLEDLKTMQLDQQAGHTTTMAC